MHNKSTVLFNHQNIRNEYFIEYFLVEGNKPVG